MPIGNKTGGFTFIEVMMALVVLSAGLVFIYKSFFLSVDYLSRLKTRLYANELIDEKIADITRVFHETADLSSTVGDVYVSRDIDHKHIDFTYKVQFLPIEGYDNLFRLNVAVSWPDAGRKTQLSRQAILSL